MIKAEIIGNLGFDAEVREFNGKPYYAMSIAHEGRNNETTWVHCYYYKSNNGSTLGNYLKKGAKLRAYGNLSVSTYDSKTTGKTAIDVTIWANELDIVLFPKKEETTAPQTEQAKNPAGKGATTEDMPF